MQGRRKIESLIDMREEDVFEPKNVRDVSYLDRDDRKKAHVVTKTEGILFSSLIGFVLYRILRKK